MREIVRERWSAREGRQWKGGEEGGRGGWREGRREGGEEGGQGARQGSGSTHLAHVSTCCLNHQLHFVGDAESKRAALEIVLLDELACAKLNSHGL